MSYVLCFRKNGVEILSIGTGHSLARVFVNKPYDKWETMKKTEFQDAKWTLTRQIEGIEDDIDIYNHMLKGIVDWEDRYEAISRIKSLEKELKDKKRTEIMIDMLEMIWEEGEFSDDGNNSGLEWAVL